MGLDEINNFLLSKLHHGVHREPQSSFWRIAFRHFVNPSTLYALLRLTAKNRRTEEDFCVEERFVNSSIRHFVNSSVPPAFPIVIFL
jgi:hypothetical protein